MRRLFFAWALAVLFFNAAAAQAATGASAYQAGVRTMKVAAAEPIPVMLFYPTAQPAHPVPMGPYQPTVAFGGKPADSFKGLILISHGTGGSELGHHNLAEQLARNGYLVAAIQHPRDNWKDRSLVASKRFFAERPKQVSRVLDALLADSYWTSRIPAGKIGAIGHSAGGYTVLALAGAMADPMRVVQHCTSAADDTKFCSLRVAPTPELREQEAAGVKPEEFDVKDARIRAVVAMAPLAQVLTAESFARIDVPVKVLAAEFDEVLAAKYHADWLRANLQKAEFEQVKNAGHFAFMMPLNRPIQSVAGDVNADPAGFDRKDYLQQLERDVLGFFAQRL